MVITDELVDVAQGVDTADVIETAKERAELLDSMESVGSEIMPKDAVQNASDKVSSDKKSKKPSTSTYRDSQILGGKLKEKLSSLSKVIKNILSDDELKDMLFDHIKHIEATKNIKLNISTDEVINVKFVIGNLTDYQKRRRKDGSSKMFSPYHVAMAIDNYAKGIEANYKAYKKELKAKTK